MAQHDLNHRRSFCALLRGNFFVCFADCVTVPYADDPQLTSISCASEDRVQLKVQDCCGQRSRIVMSVGRVRRWWAASVEGNALWRLLLPHGAIQWCASGGPFASFRSACRNLVGRFSLFQREPLKSLMLEFAQRKGVSIDSLVFHFDGEELPATATCEDVGLEDDFCIDVTAK